MTLKNLINEYKKAHEKTEKIASYIDGRVEKELIKGLDELERKEDAAYKIEYDLYIKIAEVGAKKTGLAQSKIKSMLSGSNKERQEKTLELLYKLQ
jgi:hypothetical protein